MHTPRQAPARIRRSDGNAVSFNRAPLRRDIRQNSAADRPFEAFSVKEIPPITFSSRFLRLAALPERAEKGWKRGPLGPVFANVP